MIFNHTRWKDKHKQAGINSFGFGGTNAHMVVQNYLGRNDHNIQSNKLLNLQPMAIIGMDVHFGGCDKFGDPFTIPYTMASNISMSFQKDVGKVSRTILPC